MPGVRNKQFIERIDDSIFQMDSNDLFVRQKSAIYMKRMLGSMKRIDEPAIEFIHWIVDQYQPQALMNLLMSRLGKKDKSEINEEDSWGNSTFEAKDGLEVLTNALLRISSRYQRYVINGVIAILDHFLSSVKGDDDCTVKENLNSIKSTFNLSDHEAEMLLFVFLMQVWKPFGDYFEDHLSCQVYEGRKHLALAIGLNYPQFQDLLSGQLFELGLLRMDFNYIELDEDICRTLDQGKAHLLNSNYFIKAGKQFVPLEHHLLPVETINHILGLLKKKSQIPTHILLYGPSGTGKTTFARAIANELKCPAYEIVHPDDNSSHGLRKAVQACINITNKEESSLLIVDESEPLLEAGRSFFHKGEVSDKGWLNQLLERPGIRALWITNHVDNIEESTKRRFSFSLGFKKFNHSKRIKLWISVLNHNRVSHLLSSEQISKLARKYDVSAGAITTAVQNFKETLKQKREFYGSVCRCLDAYQTLLNDGLSLEIKAKLQQDFSLEGLNFKTNIDDFMDRMDMLNRKMSDSKDTIGVNILFYGPSGTGKSEFAKYLAQRLDLDLVIKYPSDILDPYVGMNEKNIARAFREASEDQSILVFEEVDSFLASREMAQRSWEVNMVNEFLTRMENFKGILVCSTNNHSWMDRAALRRFMFKIKFDYLLPEGKLIFYRKMLRPLVESDPDKDQVKHLKCIKNLTPGDFRVVRDKYQLLPDSDISNAQLIKSLELEVGMKNEHSENKIVGF